MRLRNIPRANQTIADSAFAIKHPETHRGQWSHVFGNNNPIYIEIGMGKGRFILDMAKTHPHINFIGIERYASVLLRAIDNMNDEKNCDLSNVYFICMDAQNLPAVFAPQEVARIFLNFSDPWPKARHTRRRLSSRNFLEIYQNVLHAGGQLELKTDNRSLFDFSLEELQEMSWPIQDHTYDLHQDTRLNFGNIMTEYEEKFSGLGQPIHKVIARPNPATNML